MKNTLGDLNNHLFAQLERLSDEGIKGEDLEVEIKRARAITYVASQIIANGTLALEAQKLVGEGMSPSDKLPPMLEAESGGGKA
jgi:hypothetical protein